MLDEQDKKLVISIVQRIKELRDKKNVSQLGVYYETGLNLSRIERCLGDIKISSIKRLCDYSGITLEEFFKGIK